MNLPAPVQGDNHKLAIASITNRTLRELVIKYDSKRTKSSPSEIADQIWAVIHWTWQNHRQEAEETIRKHIAGVQDVDAWLQSEYEADAAKYNGQQVPA